MIHPGELPGCRVLESIQPGDYLFQARLQLFGPLVVHLEDFVVHRRQVLLDVGEHLAAGPDLSTLHFGAMESKVGKSIIMIITHRVRNNGSKDIFKIEKDKTLKFSFLVCPRLFGHVILTTATAFGWKATEKD